MRPERPRKQGVAWSRTLVPSGEDERARLFQPCVLEGRLELLEFGLREADARCLRHGTPLLNRFDDLGHNLDGFVRLELELPCSLHELRYRRDGPLSLIHI